MVDVVVGLGANLGEPASSFATALKRLAGKATLVGSSRLWRTRPVGPDQPDYTNAAIRLLWPGHPRELLDFCLEIEEAVGRNRETEDRWGPRVLDLDLLLARDLVWRSPSLELPHPRFHERAFALVPAAEIAPEWIHPTTGQTLSDLADTARATEPDALISSEPFPIAPGSLKNL